MLLSLPQKFITVTNDTLLSVGTSLILADTSSNNITLTIPDLETIAGSIRYKENTIFDARDFNFWIKKISGSNTLTIKSVLGLAIEGSPSLSITTNNQAVLLKFNGTAFYKVSEAGAKPNS